MNLLIKCEYIKYPHRGLVKDYLCVHNPPMDQPKKSRGRPRIKNPATARVGFRCTPQEKQGYRRKAKPKGVSAWLRELADKA